MGERVESTLLKKFFPQILETDMGARFFVPDLQEENTRTSIW